MNCHPGGGIQHHHVDNVDAGIEGGGVRVNDGYSIQSCQGSHGTCHQNVAYRARIQCQAAAGDIIRINGSGNGDVVAGLNGDIIFQHDIRNDGDIGCVLNVVAEIKDCGVDIQCFQICGKS